MSTDPFVEAVGRHMKKKSLDGLRGALVHGFNVKDRGYGTVDQCAPVLDGCGAVIDKDETDYGHFNLAQVRLVNGERRRKVLYRLARAFETVDFIVTHSNGANFTDLALRMLPAEHDKTIVVVHVSAAMNRDTEPAPAVKSELNLITPKDGWVRASSYLPFHRWGRRGAYGYNGEAKFVKNISRKEVKRHSDWWKSEHLFMTSFHIIEHVKESLQ